MGALDQAMRRYAEQAVAGSRALPDGSLDFSVASAAFVDRQLAGLAAAAGTQPDTASLFNSLATHYGAYVGEVIRQNGSGLWLKDVPGVTPGQVALCVGKENIYPLSAVAGFLRGRPTVLAGSELRTVQDYVRHVLSTQERWLHSMVLSGAPDVERLRAEMCPDPALSAFLVNQCGQIVMTAALKWGVMLDFSEESLGDLEEVLTELHRGLQSASPDDMPAASNVRAMTIGFGVYVGEVIRRITGGQWKNDGVDGQGKVLRLVVGNVTMYPLRKVEKRLTEGAAENVRFYVHATRKVIAGEAGL